MWDFLTKKCGIFGIEGGTKLWDFQHRGGDFRPLTSGHTEPVLHQPSQGAHDMILLFAFLHTPIGPNDIF